MENIQKIKLKLFICSFSFLIIYFSVAFSMLMIEPKEKKIIQSNFKITEKSQKKRGIFDDTKHHFHLQLQIPTFFSAFH